MTAMPSSELNAVAPGNQGMKVQFEYAEKTVLATSGGYLEERRATSPDTQINIFAGGWDDDADDDENDYVDMAPVQPQRPRAATQAASQMNCHPELSRGKASNRLEQLKSPTPEVVVLPASPHGSLASTSSMRTHSRSPSPVASTDESDSEDSDVRYRSDSGQTSDDENEDGEDRRSVKTSPRSSSRSSIPPKASVVTSPPPQSPRRQTTTAGQAARKYLQMHQASRPGSQYDRESSPGLCRSSSRVGTRGVQNRISKSRSQLNTPVRARSTSVNQPESNGENVSRIIEARQKSRTLDRALSGIKQSTGMEDPDRDAVMCELLQDEDKRKSRDGASVMKMISDRGKRSQSLDSKYLQYLDGISKHASAPNSPCKDGPASGFENLVEKNSARKDSNSKKSSKKKSKEELDDEEEFRKYAEIMSTKTRTSGAGSSTDLSARTLGSLEGNLSQFISEHSKEKAKADKLAKKKLQNASIASKFSFRKSKTFGKGSLERKGKNNFAESAEAFHNKLSKEGMQPSKDDAPAENNQAKAHSLKREKRKSWKKKHGLSIKSRSKERINSDPASPIVTGNPASPPMTPTDPFQNEKSEMRGKSPPVIKQSLGYKGNNSPNLRVQRSANNTPSHRNRTTSFDRDDAPTHSPKIMSPATVRSLTLDNRRLHPSGKALVRAGSSGQLVTHPALTKVNSLTSENSGSNSDISVVLDDEYEEFKAKHGVRAGTLSRLLGRKLKDRKLENWDFDDPESAYYKQEIYNSTGSLGRRRQKRGKSATLGSPSMTLRQRYVNNGEAFVGSEPVDIIDLFFHPAQFVHGFRVNCDDEEEEGDDVNGYDITLQFEAARVNKYATITGARTPQYGNYETGSLKKRTSDTALINRNNSSPTTTRRNRSLPTSDVPQRTKSSKGRGFGAAISRTLQRGSPGPSGHLAFSEALTEDEVVGNSTERPSASPLRKRKIQTVESLLEEPSPKILAAARTLYRRLVATRGDLLQLRSATDEREYYDSSAPDQISGSSYQNSAFGQDLVTWLSSQLSTAGHETSNESSSAQTEARRTACGMLQALLEEGALAHVRKEHHFQDTYLLYQFHESATKHDDVTPNGRPVSIESTVSSSTINSDVHSTTSAETNDPESQNEDSSRNPSRNPSIRSSHTATSERWVPSTADEHELKDVLSYLQNLAPDAMFRMVLRKMPEDRAPEELMMIYEEILHIKALAHLSDSVKRELAGVLKFEFHRKRGKTLFSQGDEGRSWYIIIKGSVDVDIQGQGVVCTLHEGDDFGNLAIINDAPRAATIVLAEDNCQLLRVDKQDFVRILKDVEANTVRLKEHEKDVLILQKIHARSSSSDGREGKFLNNNTKVNQRLPAAATPTRHTHRYAISAGTPAKIVEHVVKSLRPWSTAKQSDEAMEDMILMYQVFMSTQELCKQLMNLYQSEQSEQIDSSKSVKRKVVYFVVRWSHIATHIFYDQPSVGPFLKELKQAVTDDGKIYPNLKEDLARIYAPEISSESPTHRGWITVESTTVQRYPQSDSSRKPHQAVKASDDVMLKVFNSNRTYTTVRLPVISTVNEVISAVAEKQGREAADLLLIQVQSDGDMYVLPKNMTSAATSVGVNGRLFICSTDEKDDIEPLAEQRNLPTNNSTVLEVVGSQEIAEHITQFDWELINSIHVMEFVHKVFGSHKFHSVTSNIDIFARRFNQLAYWAPTEICACNNVNKRVHLLRKFIKIAQHLKELQNMNAFMAVMIGLGNQALSRLHGTWDKLPTKYKKLMTEFEAVLDPSRNHRAYRLHVATLRPPMIPYLPLLMKDMTFQHEGNDSMRDGLINFEKMHMMSNSIRGVIQACCRPLEMSHAVITSKTYDETRQYTRSFGVITDQKLLNHLSGKVESKR